MTKILDVDDPRHQLGVAVGLYRVLQQQPGAGGRGEPERRARVFIELAQILFNPYRRYSALRDPGGGDVHPYRQLLVCSSAITEDLYKAFLVQARFCELRGRALYGAGGSWCWRRLVLAAKSGKPSRGLVSCLGGFGGIWSGGAVLCTVLLADPQRRAGAGSDYRW